MVKILLAIIGVFILLCVITGISGCNSYNGVVTLSQGVDAQWAQVQSVYQRRADLIPNLVSTVSGAANFEKSTLVEVTEARKQVTDLHIDPSTAPTSADQLKQFQAAQNSLGASLSRLLVVNERYPDLKSNTNFLQLQAQLEGTENRISVERERFNVTVKDYDTKIQQFPTVIVAHLGGFVSKPYFEAAADAQTAPKVNFDFSGTPATKP